MSVHRLQAAFKSRKALVTYLMAGDASVDDFATCANAGADVLELGFPFSDPIADGPVIQAAATRALAKGTTLPKVFEVAKAVRARTEKAIVLMGYLNPVLAFGIEKFLAACAASGVDGVIIPDLPPEEAHDLCAAAKRHDVGVVFLLAPTSTPERERAVLAAATGFIYFVSVTGVTGARAEVSDVSAHVERVRSKAQVPVVIGFGVSTPAHAARFAQSADGVVVGSALVDRLARAEPLLPFVQSLRAAF